MTTKLDYGKLTLKDALDVAIIIEDEAKERYEELADQLAQHRTSDAAAFFRQMVVNETRHGDDLRQQRNALFGQEPVEIDRSVIPEVETTDYDSVRAFMTPHQALRIALANENRAHAFYDNALAHVQDEQVRKLFTELREEETDHQQQVRGAMEKLPPEDKTNPEDFVDEPTAQ